MLCVDSNYRLVCKIITDFSVKFDYLKIFNPYILMNIAQMRKTYKAISSLFVFMEATLHIPDSDKDTASDDHQVAIGGSVNRPQTVHSSHYSFERYPENETKVSIPSQGITSIDSNIKRLVKLKKLYLWNNNLKSLPPEIGELKNLQELSLSGNKLKALSAEIGKLVNLQDLNLNGNEFELLPAEIGKLENLNVLYFRSNKLKTLSAEIRELKNLQYLYLDYNKLETLSDVIGELKNLQYLHFNYNKLKSLPAEIG
ncbi:uncharacterized protein VICG_02142, partial [Vittaforma corneae ATCC 50505]